MNVDSLRNIVNNIDQEACICTIRTVGNNNKDEDILKGLFHQIFKAFYDLRYQICTFCVGTDGF
jgi:hypothetical protein